MATITGFTAERMLVIENETVVDGEVQGDNLILITREGTPIDAGNVRGPVGPTGPAGGVSSINDQTGPVYAPRIFANKTALDAWAAAPSGAVAVTTDSEVIWEKNGSGWVATSPSHVFTSATDRDARWATPAEGSYAVTTDDDVSWYKSPAGWNVDGTIRIFATAAERTARWPSPPIGAYSLCLDTHTFMQFVPGGGSNPAFWRPLTGTLVYSEIATIPQGTFTGAGLRDVISVASGITFPYITRSVASYTLQAGFSGDWVGWAYDLWGLGPNGVMAQGNSAAGTGVWQSGTLPGMWLNNANTSVGCKGRMNPNQFGGGTNYTWYGGYLSLQVFVA